MKDDLINFLTDYNFKTPKSQDEIGKFEFVDKKNVDTLASGNKTVIDIFLINQDLKNGRFLDSGEAVFLPEKTDKIFSRILSFNKKTGVNVGKKWHEEIFAFIEEDN